MIDGRRANCNLASLGRPRPSFPFHGIHIFICHCLFLARVFFCWVLSYCFCNAWVAFKIVVLMDLITGQLRSAAPILGRVQTPRAAYMGSPNPAYHHPLPHGYQPGFVYPSYGWVLNYRHQFSAQVQLLRPVGCLCNLALLVLTSNCNIPFSKQMQLPDWVLFHQQQFPQHSILDMWASGNQFWVSKDWNFS